MTTSEDLKGMVVPIWAELMEMELTPAAQRVAWVLLCWSYRLGRMATRPFTVRDLERRTGMGHQNALNALKDLKGFNILRRCGEGWQIVPQSQVHRWGGRRRLVEDSQVIIARRLDAGQGVANGEMALPAMEEPRLDVAMAEVAVEGATKDRRPRTEEGRPGTGEGTAHRAAAPYHADDGEGGDGTGGGAKNFLPPAGLDSRLSEAAVSFNSFSPLTRGPIKTITPIREPGLESRPTPSLLGEEAGSGMGTGIPEDPSSCDEEVLMRRLREALGDEVMRKKGRTLRLFIRGSRDAGDSNDTAEAMRKAINETVAADREGKIKKSVYGYLSGLAFYWAGRRGWRFDAATKKWTKGRDFSTWEVRQSLKNSIKRTTIGAA